MKKLLLISVVILMVAFTGCGGNSAETETVETPTDWETVFSASGFTSEEIASYKEILTNVGITDYHNVEVFENGRMHIVKGKVYDSEKCSLRLTLEDRKIIVVCLNIPSETSTPYINWRGALKFRHEPSWDNIDLYYDVDGGYVAKLDWENKMITPYNE